MTALFLPYFFIDRVNQNLIFAHVERVCSLESTLLMSTKNLLQNGKQLWSGLTNFYTHPNQIVINSNNVMSTLLKLSRALRLTRAFANTHKVSKSWFRASSFLNIDISESCIDMAIDCHKGDGALALDPIQLPAQDVPKPEVERLQSIVKDHDVTSVLLSWPVQDAESVSQVSSRIINCLNATLRESHGDSVRTTKPFYMLDGGGRRMASLCLVKNHPPTEQSIKAPAVDDYLLLGSKKQDYQVTGTWLKNYSTLRSLQRL